MNHSLIVLCNDIEYAKEQLLQEYASAYLKTFFTDEFKVEDAQAVIREAYIAEERQKVLILAALSYNIYAQNALLKLLEEPPRNIRFILISRSKNALLPTVRSRLQLRMMEAPKPQLEFDLDVAHLDLEAIFAFLKTHRHVNKDTLKQIIQRLLEETVVHAGIRLSEEELSQFDMALELAELNTRAQNILSLLLLTIYEARMRMR